MNNPEKVVKSLAAFGLGGLCVIFLLDKNWLSFAGVFAALAVVFIPPKKSKLTDALRLALCVVSLALLVIMLARKI
jgi:hypothetical protein